MTNKPKEAAAFVAKSATETAGAVDTAVHKVAAAYSPENVKSAISGLCTLLGAARTVIKSSSTHSRT
jgi:hypothetical protein